MNTPLVNLTNIDYSFAALNEGFQGSGSSAAQDNGSASSNRVTIRQITPPRMAKLYLSYGLLAGSSALGGSGPARRIRMGNKDIARSGGSVFDFGKMAPMPDYRAMAKANRSYQTVQQEPHKVRSFLPSTGDAYQPTAPLANSTLSSLG